MPWSGCRLFAELAPPPPENEGGYVHSRKPLGNISGYSVLEKESPAEAGLRLRLTLLAAFLFLFSFY
jgi:hypothetical protein